MQNENAIAKLKAFIAQFETLCNYEFEELSSCFKTSTFRKGQLLFSSGVVAREMFFIPEGFVRFYHIKDDGTEVTSDFFFAPGFITSFTSLITQNPSIVNIQALTIMGVLSLSYGQLQELYRKHHSIERLGRLLSEQAFIASEKHLLSFLNDSPRDRYLWLCKEYPEYIKNIPLQYLASYLGVTPETLSRIRSRTL